MKPLFLRAAFMTESRVSILVGGITASIDFIPSIVYVALYKCALLNFFWRICDRKSRTWLTMHTGLAIAERIAMFLLRAAVSQFPDTESEAMSEYIQWAIATFPIALCQDLSFILRSLVVKALGDTSTSTINFIDTSYLRLMVSSVPPHASSLPIGASQEFYRRVHYIYEGWLVTTFTLGAVGNTLVISQRENQIQSIGIHALRYTSGVMTSIATSFLTVCCILSSRTIPRLNQTAVYFILIQSLLLSVPCLYRLWALSHTTTADLLLTTAAPLNSHGDKAVFYMINILPEFFVAMSVVCVDAKEFFGVGSEGDKKSSK